MKRSGWFALISILSFSILIRTIPLYEYSLWGLDSGEYFYYTHNLVEDGSIHLSIDGWAKAYPYFPGMFILGGSFHLLSETNLFHSVTFIPVLISSLSPLFLFLIAHKIMKNWRPAVLSAFLFSVLPPLNYAYSQPRPETTGFFFFLLILSMSMTKIGKHKKNLVLILICGIALIISHHLSTYFILLFFLGGIFVSKLWRKHNWGIDDFRIQLFLMITMLTFAYWIFYAIPFREGRIRNALIFPNYTILLIPFILVGFIKIISHLRRKLDFTIPINLHEDDIKSFLLVCLIVAIIVLPILVNIAMGTFPVRDIELGSTILFYLPIFFLGLFALSAGKLIRALKEGPTILGWIIFIIFSIVAGVVLNSSSLLPMRQFTFFLVTICICFGIGLFHFSSVLYNPKGDFNKTVVLGIIILILASILVPLTYPSQERAGGFTERIESEDMEASFWARSSLTGKIAGDHRMSNSLFSVGYENLTWRDGYDMYFSSNFTEALEDIEDNNVSYIMWDQEMKRGAAIVLGENPQPLDPQLIKEYHEKFRLIYLSEEVRVYEVLEDKIFDL